MYTTLNFESVVTFKCGNDSEKQFTFDYPFRFGEHVCPKASGVNETLFISAVVSSDARFFVATGVLSILYCVFIVCVYTLIDEIYKSKSEIPLAVSIKLSSCFSEYMIIVWLILIRNINVDSCARIERTKPE